MQHDSDAASDRQGNRTEPQDIGRGDQEHQAISLGVPGVRFGDRLTRWRGRTERRRPLLSEQVQNSEAKPKRGRGRPRLEIDLIQVTDMASEFCTQEEIAAEMGFSVGVFGYRKDIKDAYNEGLMQGKGSLRHLQYIAAKNGNVQMMIWLGRQYLGQKDTLTEVNQPDTIKIVLERKNGNSIDAG